jgi:signal transduction histidine kinase
MDAMSAAIAHEVGQSLAGVTLNARAGLDWLNRSEPNTEMAIKSLNTTVDGCRSTFDVIKSVRAISAKGRDSRSQFDVNELVRETMSLLDREMAAQNVSLQVELGQPLPPILADRVQIQRVLINLLRNAIESVGSDRRGSRLIGIRSASLNNRNVLVEVSDSGVGNTREKIDHVFEPFFTSNPTGTGLGLPLSRTIVEEHGGSLWASWSDDCGAVFHLQMPQSVTTMARH